MENFWDLFWILIASILSLIISLRNGEEGDVKFEVAKIIYVIVLGIILFFLIV